MSGFQQPDVAPFPGRWWRPNYQLRGDYLATWTAADGRVLRVIVPDGFRSDGSTEWLLLPLGFVPALLLWLFGIAADGTHRAGWLAHDWIYSRCGAVPYQVQVRTSWLDGIVPLTRAEADHAFYALSLLGGTLWWRAFPRWLVLRAVGWVSWRRDRLTYR